MAKSRRKAGGATSGKYKPKKMGKGWSAYRPKLGFRPPVLTDQPKAEEGEAGKKAEKAKAEDSNEA